MEAKHTKGAYTVIHNSWECSTVYGPNGNVVAVCPIDANVTEESQVWFEAIKEASAVRIALCLGSHDALVNALRLARSYMSEAVEYESPCAKRDAETVDAALALAGETP